MGTFWPWADPALLGPTRLEHYLLAYLGILLPSMLAVSAIIFAIAVATRSLLLSYLATLALLVLYLVTGESNALPPVFDPFLFEVFDDQTRYWTAVERNARLLAFEGQVLTSRLLWTAIAGSAFAIAYRLFSFRALAAKRTRTTSMSATSSVGRPAEGGGNPAARARPTWHRWTGRCCAVRRFWC
jgi:hypothetical protein